MNKKRIGYEHLMMMIIMNRKKIMNVRCWRRKFHNHRRTMMICARFFVGKFLLKNSFENLHYRLVCLCVSCVCVWHNCFNLLIYLTILSNPTIFFLIMRFLRNEKSLSQYGYLRNHHHLSLSLCSRKSIEKRKKKIWWMLCKLLVVGHSHKFFFVSSFLHSQCRWDLLLLIIIIISLVINQITNFVFR